VSEELGSLVEELESVAARLRSGDLEAGEAARLVERCAELAARVGGQLDAESKAAEAPDSGQERLL
jgi:hypothetical protein